MTQYILKEYGAWTVMILSFLTGALTSGETGINVIASFLAFALLINSKQAFTGWIRGTRKGKPLIIFISQILIASLIFIALFGADTFKLLPYLIIPVIYLLLFRFAGEHFFLTEVCGFALLTLSSLVARFSITGDIDNNFYLSVVIFFIAGVFRVRVQTRKGTLERVSTVFYVIFAVFVYHLIKTPVVILLPLIDNLILSITLYSVRLKTTGWIELTKGVVFLLLNILFI